MIGFLLGIHIVVTVLLILAVLVQKNEGGSSLFASNSSSSGGVFNARGTSNLLTKATWFFAAVFLVNCVLMAHISSSNIREAQSVVSSKDKNIAQENEENI